MLIVVNFHYVRPTFDHPYPGIHGITPDRLRAQLELLGRAGTFVSPEQVREAVRGGALLPQRSILVTFDDGLREQVEHAGPVLQALGVPALFFVNTAPIAEGRVSTVHQIQMLRASLGPGDFAAKLRRHAGRLGIGLDLDGVGERAVLQYRYDTPEAARMKYALNFLLSPEDTARLVQALFEEVSPSREAEVSRSLYMDREHLRRLSEEGMLGTHAHEHLPLGLFPRSVAAELIRRSLDLLEVWTGRRPFALSYPYGGPDACPAEAGQVASELGLEFAMTMERAGNAGFDRPFHLGRFDCNDLPGGSSPRFDIGSVFESVPQAVWPEACP